MQVKSIGGNITGIGTIHGDVDISAAGDSVNNTSLISISPHHLPCNNT